MRSGQTRDRIPAFTDGVRTVPAGFDAVIRIGASPGASANLVSQGRKGYADLLQNSQGVARWGGGAGGPLAGCDPGSAQAPRSTMRI